MDNLKKAMLLVEEAEIDFDVYPRPTELQALTAIAKALTAIACVLINSENPYNVEADE